MKFTYAQVEGFSPRLKDNLCDVFNFIHRHKGSTALHLKDVDFTPVGVLIALRTLKGVGRSDETWVTNFLDSLEVIETFATIQPTARVFFFRDTETEVNGQIESVEIGEEKTFTSFDIEKLKEKIRLSRYAYPKLSLVFKNYIPAEVELF